MNGRRIVVDASIAFRALSRGRNDLVAMLRPAGRPADSTLLAPRFLFVELFKHQEHIVRASRLPEASLWERGKKARSYSMRTLRGMAASSAKASCCQELLTTDPFPPLGSPRRLEVLILALFFRL